MYSDNSSSALPNKDAPAPTSEKTSLSDFYDIFYSADIASKQQSLNKFLDQVHADSNIIFSEKDAALLILLLQDGDESLKHDALSIALLIVNNSKRIDLFTQAGGIKYCIHLLLQDSLELRKKTLTVLNQCLTEYDEQAHFITSGGVDNIISLLRCSDNALSLLAARLLQMLTYEINFQLLLLKKDNCTHFLKEALYNSESKLQEAVLLILINLEGEAKTFFFEEDVLLFLQDFSAKSTGLMRVLSMNILSRCSFILKKYQRESFVSKKEFKPYTNFILDINALAVLPGERFATGDREGMIIIWSLASMLPEHILLSESSVMKIKALPDNVRFSHGFVSAHANKTLLFWDFMSGQCIRTVTEEGNISDLAFLSNGRLVVASHCRYALKIMSRSYKESILDLRCFGLHPISVIGLPGEQLAVVNRYSEKIIEVWDTQSCKKITPFPEQEKDIYKLINLQNANIATCATGGVITIWEVASRKLLKKISTTESNRIDDLQTVGEGGIIGSTHKDIFIWSITTGLLMKSLQLPQHKRIDKFIVLSTTMLLVNITERGQSFLTTMEIYPNGQNAYNEDSLSIPVIKSSLFFTEKALALNGQQSLNDYYSYDRPSFRHRVFT